MTLKLVLLSVDGTICRDDTIQVAVATDLAELARKLHGEGIAVALWSNRAWTVGGKPMGTWFSDLAGVPVALHGSRTDATPARRMANSSAPILLRYGAGVHETVLVGGAKDDMIAGVNNKLLLIRPDWYGQQMDYGFPVKTVGDLARFLFVFAMRKHPIFWRVNEAEHMINSAGPFSTMREDYAEFGVDARAAAKDGKGRQDFWFYLVAASLYFGGIIQGVDILSKYPSHDPAKGGVKSGIDDLLNRLGKCFNKAYYRDLIVRHTKAAVSHKTNAAGRSFMTQLNTIKLQRRPRQWLQDEPRGSDLRLTDKDVLVVDDICTSGKSFEAARTYIKAAGGTAVSYSWLKTINTDYTALRPLPVVKPYEANTFIKEPKSVAKNYQAGIVDPQAPLEIRRIFRKYLSWKDSDWRP